MRWKIQAEMTFRVEVEVAATDLSRAQTKFLESSMDRCYDQLDHNHLWSNFITKCDPVVKVDSVKNSEGLGESCTPFCDDGPQYQEDGPPTCRNCGYPEDSYHFCEPSNELQALYAVASQDGVDLPCPVCDDGIQEKCPRCGKEPEYGTR